MYCQESDMNQYLGGIPIASGITKTTFIERAADEIHTAGIGLYEIPFVIESSVSTITSGATANILKNWNAQLSAGRIILAASITQENFAVHDYGNMLIKDVLDNLEKLTTQKIVLAGCTADTSALDDKIKPMKALISSPDGTDTALDDKSFFNRPYEQVGDKSYEVDGGPDL